MQMKIIKNLKNKVHFYVYDLKNTRFSIDKFARFAYE